VHHSENRIHRGSGFPCWEDPDLDGCFESERRMIQTGKGKVFGLDGSFIEFDVVSNEHGDSLVGDMRPKYSVDFTTLNGVKHKNLTVDADKLHWLYSQKFQ
jgi:hypothetical protein